MKRPNYLKGLRVTLAILLFVPILLYFLDIRYELPAWFKVFPHIQILPAILAGTALIILLQLALVLLFGRIYCSTICPAGILQDIINRIYCIGKKKKKGSQRFKYHKANNILRYGLTGIIFILLFLGFAELTLLFDPYSNFGRITANIFRPVAVWVNNLLASGLARFDNYTLYHISISTVTTFSLIAALVALILFVVLASWRGRIFCNTLCPVGGLLSLFSRFSLFNVHINEEKCISCGLCEKSCKAEAIDTKNLTVDNSRCVDCFNCISSCKKDSISYSFNPPWSGKKEKTTEKTVEAVSETAAPTTNTRRHFLATSATVAATLPIASAWAQKQQKSDRPNPITPPGSISLERFKDKCTGCHLCVVQCPSHVLRPAGLEFGLGYMLKPHMAYIDSYCNYECTICADVCPNHAIHLDSKEEKLTTQVGIAEFFLNRCIVETENTDCGACSEHCPTQAVHMERYKEGSTLTVPVVEPHLCIGCGGCESICPVRPNRAIIVKANPIHQQVEKPAEEEIKEFEIDDFGF
ncbi:ferredoxin [Parabacteroides sp. PFB2-10]|uniref:4Fe-4S binding protein n=1 Tax=Parabacteroides sp. PFB2-10 TaxID=1742405 RepID=UPI002475CB1A|nr:4Fe-4S binding protein [Parabacteroides sp. PFB2-10]MDH6312137.1 ferredoxin [Parabacteroides sp. PFB2-10]